MVNINAFIAALKTTWLRKDNNSPWSIILVYDRYKHVLNFWTHLINEKILPKIKKPSLGETNSYPI